MYRAPTKYLLTGKIVKYRFQYKAESPLEHRQLNIWKSSLIRQLGNQPITALRNTPKKFHEISQLAIQTRYFKEWEQLLLRYTKSYMTKLRNKYYIEA